MCFVSFSFIGVCVCVCVQLGVEVWKGANKSDKAKDENHENKTTKKVRGSSNISSTAGITKTTYPLPKRFSNPPLNNNNNNNTLFTFESLSSQKKTSLRLKRAANLNHSFSK